MDDRAIVAGLRDGPGAADVVCVCERADRELSKNSRIFYPPPQINTAKHVGGVETDPDLRIRNRLESALNVCGQRFLKGHNETR